ncbi:MAG: adenosine kinase [Spirochaetales bacterium]|nr:adenosine kinase [Spirochaetales bacterium]
MTLVDPATQGRLLNALQHHELELRSGGSAANTMFALVRSGGSAFYTGKVARDSNGEFYREDLLRAGIHFDIHPAAPSEGNTGTCLVMTTPDAERTMCTHLGVSTALSVGDVDLNRLARSHIVYLEGYLWDADRPRAACEAAMEAARSSGVQIAYTFSDSFCVDRFRDDYSRILKDYIDILFCNAAELTSFFQTDDFSAALSLLSTKARLAFVTHGADGAYVLEAGRIEHVAGFPVDPLDTNGAGDAFAGGVLYALCAGHSAPQAARWGNFLAGKIVQVRGPRLEEDVAHLVATIL